ncbi:MAG: hypothetical protein PVJ07_08115, partial [Anaerolineales bacterium]
LLVGAVAGRASGASGAKPAGLGAAGGAALGIGLGVLAFFLPFVQVESPSPDEQPVPLMPICDQFLDPSAYVPANGAVLPDGDFSFAWDWLLDPPQEPVLWLLELQGPGGTVLSQVTEDMSLAFNAFGHPPDPCSVFAWRLSGETLDPAGARQPFCDPTPWRAFMIGQYPPLDAPPWTFEAPGIPEGCLYSSIRNSMCRASDYVESDEIAILQPGEIAELMALNPEHTHGLFELASMQQCWIWLELMDGPDDPIETCGVPVVDPAPRPTDDDTRASCRPDLDREACEAAGGTMSTDLTTAPYCICP